MLHPLVWRLVSDSLVMVDFINRHRSTHDEPEVAVREAGVVRFLPILLTSLTTFAGLSLLLLERRQRDRAIRDEVRGDTPGPRAWGLLSLPA